MIKIESITEPGFRMDYFRFGTGKNKMIIIPGLSIQSVMPFADLIERDYFVFSRDFTIYVFDRRYDINPGYSINDMADDTVRALEFLNIDKAYIFGASQGGMIGMVMAVCHPELVVKIALGSTAARISGELNSRISQWIELARLGKAEELVPAFSKMIYPAEVYEKSKDIILNSAKHITAGDLKRFEILAGSLIDFDITGKLGALNCPAFVIGSLDDELLGGESSRELHGLIPGSELFMYNGYGHAAYDLAPEYKEKMFSFFMK